MYKIFETEVEAQEFIDAIDLFLRIHCKGYAENTTHWGSPDKSDNAEQWMVKVPREFQVDNLYKTKEGLNIKTEIEKVVKDIPVFETRTKLPVDWRNIEEIESLNFENVT